MALIKSVLEMALKSIADSPPNSAALAASQWADAIANYALTITPPSTTTATAKGPLQSSLLTAFGTTNAAPLMEAAMQTYAAAVGLGMAGFVAIPPVSPIGFSSLFSVNYPDTTTPINGISTAIDLWFKTGSSTPIAGGSPIPWL